MECKCPKCGYTAEQEGACVCPTCDVPATEVKEEAASADAAPSEAQEPEATV